MAIARGKSTKRRASTPKVSVSKKIASGDGPGLGHKGNAAREVSFKDPTYLERILARRKWKSVKQFLEQSTMASGFSASNIEGSIADGKTMSVQVEVGKGKGKGSQAKASKKPSKALPSALPNTPPAPPLLYTSIEAPPSVQPLRKYCDITGLPASYVDPSTNLRYHSATVYQFIKSLSTTATQEYLHLRGAGVILK